MPNRSDIIPSDHIYDGILSDLLYTGDDLIILKEKGPCKNNDKTFTNIKNTRYKLSIYII